MKVKDLVEKLSRADGEMDVKLMQYGKPGDYCNTDVEYVVQSRDDDPERGIYIIGNKESV